ncbi:hypothetical protein B566_EDAN007830 [Ephemera danica]|nr:hypothetical protein B566_EDAN007830 [Ephemera danica]
MSWTPAERVASRDADLNLVQQLLDGDIVRPEFINKALSQLSLDLASIDILSNGCSSPKTSLILSMTSSYAISASAMRPSFSNTTVLSYMDCKYFQGQFEDFHVSSNCFFPAFQPVKHIGPQLHGHQSVWVAITQNLLAISKVRYAGHLMSMWVRGAGAAPQLAIARSLPLLGAHASRDAAATSGESQQKLLQLERERTFH